MSRQDCSLNAIRTRLLAALSVITVVAAGFRAGAQPVAGDVSPDRLHLGEVRIGATVEADLHVFEDGDDPTGIEPVVRAPPFVRIDDVSVTAKTYGAFGTMIVCDVRVSIVTDRVGEHAGHLHVEVGSASVDVPIDVTVRAQEPGLTRLLVVETPFRGGSTSNAVIFDPWLDITKAATLDANYWIVERDKPVLRGHDLSKFDVILLSGSGIYWVNDEDIASLKQFVAGGGRVILAANYFMRGTVAKANQILEGSGLQMRDVEPPFAERSQKVQGAAIVADPLNEHVTTLEFFRPSPVAVTDPQKAKLLVAAPPFPGEGFVAVAHSGKGEFIALGTSLWWHWIAREDASGSDNSRLLRNLVTRSKE